MKPTLIIVFILMCASQWFVPGVMIAEQEAVLSDGKTFHFKTEPIDPSDPFRGKYITLDFEDARFRDTGGRSWESGQDVFVVIDEDDEGFAKVVDVVHSEPATEPFFEAEVAYIDGDYVQIQFPFDRFYVEESKASEAERLYWEASRDTTQVAYAVVNIREGKAALRDVMINDRSIVDIVKELNSDEPR
jgi:uncharacterized membrane-anchored protein